MADLTRLANEVTSLLDELREAGYSIGAREYIDVQNLLIALAERDELPSDVERLRTLLSPLVCSTPQQQDEFGERFARWAVDAEALLREEGEEEAEQPRRQSLEQELEEKQHQSRIGGRVYQVLQTALIVGALGWVFFGEIKERFEADSSPAPPDQEEVGAGQGGGRGTEPIGAEPGRDDPATILTPSEPEEVVGAFESALVALGGHLMEWRWWILASIGTMSLTYAGHRSYQRNLANRFASTRLSAGAPVAELITAGEQLEPFDRPGMFRAAQNFRQHRRIGGRYFDAEATIAASLARGGRYTPVERHRLTVPEYTVLVDQRTPRDHQALGFLRLMDWMRQQGVLVHTYTFDDDPRVVRSRRAPGKAPATLSIDELADRSMNTRLMIYSSGARMFDASHGGMEDWVAAFDAWPLRALITPVPAWQWGRREEALANRNWLVFPGTEEGLRTLVAHVDHARQYAPPRDELEQLPLPRLIRDDPDRWLDRHAPEPELIEELVDDLRWYLDEGGFQWLQACAVYGEIHWNITLKLGRGLKDEQDRPLLTEERLLSLSRLPWFRTGQMPIWLRTGLLRHLSREQKADVQRVLDAVFETATEEGAADGELFEIALQNPGGELGRRLLDRLRTIEPPDSPLREQVFSTFMGNRLSIPLVEAVRGLLQGEPGELLPGERTLRRGTRICLALAWLSMLSVFILRGGAGEALFSLLWVIVFSLPIAWLGWAARNSWAFGLGLGNSAVALGVFVYWLYGLSADSTSDLGSHFEWLLVLSSPLYLAAWFRWTGSARPIFLGRALAATRRMSRSLIVAAWIVVVFWLFMWRAMISPTLTQRLESWADAHALLFPILLVVIGSVSLAAHLALLPLGIALVAMGRATRVAGVAILGLLALGALASLAFGLMGALIWIVVMCVLAQKASAGALQRAPATAPHVYAGRRPFARRVARVVGFALATGVAIALVDFLMRDIPPLYLWLP